MPAKGQLRKRHELDRRGLYPVGAVPSATPRSAPPTAGVGPRPPSSPAEHAGEGRRPVDLVPADRHKVLPRVTSASPPGDAIATGYVHHFVQGRQRTQGKPRTSRRANPRQANGGPRASRRANPGQADGRTQGKPTGEPRTSRRANPGQADGGSRGGPTPEDSRGGPTPVGSSAAARIAGPSRRVLCPAGPCLTAPPRSE